MPRPWFLVLAALGAGSALAPACGGTSTSSGTPLPCAVDDVLARNCRTCHQAPPVYGAPMPLVNWEDVHALAHSDGKTPVYQMMGARIHDDKAPMPQPPNPRLSPQDTTVLDDWIAAGAPARSAGDTCGGGNDDAGADAADPNACTPDTHIAPTSAWTMPQADANDYVCYGFDVTPAQKRQVIQIAPHVDDKTIVHHILLFQSQGPTSYDGTPRICDNDFGDIGWTVVYAWAPGGATLVLPPEAGFPQEGTTHYVVQVHYNNINHLAGEQDKTGFDLCTTDQLRPNDADVFAFGSMKFTVPPHATLDWSCKYTVDANLAGVHVFSGFPHMHQIGLSISTTLAPAQGGGPIDLGTDPNFNFDYQHWRPVDATLQAGDVATTRCVWQNPKDTAVKFGVNTEDEMCFGFSMYYPKRNLLNWAIPASGATCGPTQ